jgi:hypothetical protein
MVAVPILTPVATPVEAFMVQIAVLLLLHTPPVVALLKVLVLPPQPVVVPEMAATVGNAFTVITLVAEAEPQLELIE